MRITEISELREVIPKPSESIVEKKVSRLDEMAIDFIRRSPFAVISTANSKGQITASPKGDSPGFIEVVDETTLMVPDRPGNGLADGHLNILQNPSVGLIFFIPNVRESLRISGTAELHHEGELLDKFGVRGRPAVLLTKVQIDEVFFHCGKALIRSELWSPESWNEPDRVSFGKAYALRQGKHGLTGKALAKVVDAAIERDYQKNL